MKNMHPTHPHPYYGKMDAQRVENEMRKSIPKCDMTNLCKDILAQSWAQKDKKCKEACQHVYLKIKLPEKDINEKDHTQLSGKWRIIRCASLNAKTLTTLTICQHVHLKIKLPEKDINEKDHT